MTSNQPPPGGHVPPAPCGAGHPAPTASAGRCGVAASSGPTTNAPRRRPLPPPMEVSFEVNGTPVTVMARPHQRLLDLLRGPLRLRGTKEACGEGECGACTVLVDGRAVNACLYPALEVEGRRVTTVEGLMGPRNRLSLLQEAFVDAGAVQCGFCTPGMVMAAHALLERQPNPSEREIAETLVGNLCRCTGYVQIIEAVRLAATRSAAPPAPGPSADGTPGTTASTGAATGSGSATPGAPPAQGGRHE